MKNRFLRKIATGILSATLLLGVMSGPLVNAAGYKQINSSGTVGSYQYKNNGKNIIIKNSKSGSRVDTIKGRYTHNIDYKLVSNGKYLYYSEINYDGKSAGYIMRYDLKKKKSNLIMSCKNQVSVEAICKDKMYFCKGDFEPDLYEYNMKTKKQRKVAVCSNVTGIYGSKLVLSIISGDYSPNPIYIYDTVTQKKTTIKDTLGCNVVGKNLYYYVTNNFKGSNCDIYVKKRNLVTGKTVDLAKVYAEQVRCISDNELLYCVRSESYDAVYYKYDINDGKSKIISYEEFCK